MIELRLLGPIHAQSADGRELHAVLAHPKRLALLVYLAVARPRGFHRRDKLVALFWPEVDQRRARQALSKAIHHLRQSIGEAAIVSRGDDEVALDAGLVRCDVAQFDGAVRENHFLEALALYRGDLADGLFVDGAGEFEQWLSAERDRLRVAAARAAGSAADALQRTNLPAAIENARLALAFSTYDESALRRLMVLLERAGDRPAAALAYSDFARRLRADLELDPSDDVRVLRESLGRETATPARSMAVRETPAPADRVVPSVSPRRRSRSFVATAGVAALAAITALAGWKRWSDRASGVDVDSSVVRVAVLENRTGDSTFNAVSAMATDWIARALTSADVARVVRGDATHAGLVISGALYKQGDSLLFQARLSDAGPGSDRMFQPVVAPIENPAAALESLREQALSLVAQATTPREASLLRGTDKPPLYAAYRDYVIGMDLHARREYARAYDHFARAAELDTSFTVAMLSAALTIETLDSRKTDSLIDRLIVRRETLSPLSQTWLDALLAQRRGDLGELSVLFDRLAHELPETLFPYFAAKFAFNAKRPREAAVRMRSLDPHTGGMQSYWVVLGMADHAAGDTAAEARDVQSALRAHPNDPAIATAAVRFLASRGRLVQADSVLDEARSMRQRSSWNAGSVFAVAAIEAAAHGHTEWAMRVRERALRWYQQLPRADSDREIGEFGLTWILYSIEAWPELEVRATRLSREQPGDARWIGLLGLVAAHKRDTIAARRFDDMLVAQLQSSGDDLRRRPKLLFDRARIAALLGDRDAAIELLRESFARGLSYNAYLHTDAAFSAMHDYGPFMRLIAPKD